APFDLLHVAVDGLTDQPVRRTVDLAGGGFEPRAGGVVEFHATRAAHALPSEPCCRYLGADGLRPGCSTSVAFGKASRTEAPAMRRAGATRQVCRRQAYGGLHPPYPARRKVRLMRCPPSKGCSPSLSASTPWWRRRSSPPHTSTSPCSSETRSGLSARRMPPNWKTAGRPSETDTMGAVKSRSSLS